MTILNRSIESKIIDFPLKHTSDSLQKYLIRQLSDCEGIEDYNTFKKSINTSSKAKKLFLILLKDKLSECDFFGKYYAYLEEPINENKAILFNHIASADIYVLNEINDEIEEIFQFIPAYFYYHLPYETKWIKQLIKDYIDLIKNKKPDSLLKVHYEEIILENFFKGVLNGLSNKISILFDEELGRA